MMTMRLLHVLGAALVVAATSAAVAQTAPAKPPAPAPVLARPMQAACFQVQPGSRAYSQVRMQLTVEHAEEDPARVWSAWDLWNPNSPQRTAIWTGVVPTCGGGEIIVSQIVNRQCSSSVVCPARVVHRRPGGERVLMGYEQICTVHGTFELQGDLGALRACDVSVALKTD